MEFYVAEDFLRYFISCDTVQRDKHGFRKRNRHETLYERIVVTDEGHKVAGLWTEAESNRKFKKESYVKIAEVDADGIQQEDILLAPLEKAFFISSFPHDPVKDLAHEHRHGILENVITDAQKGVTGNNIPCRIKS